MTRGLCFAGVMMVAGCTNTAGPVSPEPDVPTATSTSTSTATATTTSTATVGASLCDEIAAVLAASESGYARHAGRSLPEASSCAVHTDDDPRYACDLGSAGTPAESGAVLKAWEAKLEGCPALAAPFKKMTLGEHGKVWSDQKTKGERTVSLAFSGDDAKPRPVLVVRRFK